MNANHLHYYNQERYKDLLKEAEKERLLKQLNESNKSDDNKEDWSWSSWLSKLSQNLKESRSLSS
jgi:hypothetical protein